MTLVLLREKPMKIVDVFPFFNELDLLDIRLNVLDPYVDCFIISEATKTFQGGDKPLWMSEMNMRQIFSTIIRHVDMRCLLFQY